MDGETYAKRADVGILAENNAAMGRILELATQSRPLEEFLEEGLETLLSVSWLSLLPKAGIFITEEDGKTLKLVAERNIGEPIKTLCDKVAFGHCLCGRAAQTQKLVHASCVDERHETMFDGISPHGHYNVPLLSGGKTLGVMVLYLPHGHARSDIEVDFLERAANTFALVLQLRNREQQLEENLRHLTKQDAALKIERQLLTTTMRNMDEGLSVFDSDLRLVISNPRYGELGPPEGTGADRLQI